MQLTKWHRHKPNSATTDKGHIDRVSVCDFNETKAPQSIRVVLQDETQLYKAHLTLSVSEAQDLSNRLQAMIKVALSYNNR